jgi:hypothetical protein
MHNPSSFDAAPAQPHARRRSTTSVTRPKTNIASCAPTVPARRGKWARRPYSRPTEPTPVPIELPRCKTTRPPIPCSRTPVSHSRTLVPSTWTLRPEQPLSFKIARTRVPITRTVVRFLGRPFSALRRALSRPRRRSRDVAPRAHSCIDDVHVAERPLSGPRQADQELEHAVRPVGCSYCPRGHAGRRLRHAYRSLRRGFSLSVHRSTRHHRALFRAHHSFRHRGKICITVRPPSLLPCAPCRAFSTTTRTPSHPSTTPARAHRSTRSFNNSQPKPSIRTPGA